MLRDEEVLRRLHTSVGGPDHPALLPIENLVHLLKTYSIIYDALSDSLALYDLSVAQYNLLAILRNTPERHLPMSEIGERMSVTRTNITKLVDCLERSGLVRRANRPGDRRVVLAELTEKAETLLEHLVPDHLESTRRLWTDMTPEDSLLLTHLLLKLRQSALRSARAAVEQEETHSMEQTEPYRSSEESRLDRIEANVQNSRVDADTAKSFQKGDLAS